MSFPDFIARSLARQFTIAAVAVALVAAVLLGGLSFRATWTILHHSVNDRLQSASMTASERTGAVLGEIQRDLSALARNSLIANALVDSAGRRTYLDPFLKGYRANDLSLLTITLYDFDGHPYASNRDGPPIPVPARTSWFAAAMSGHAKAEIHGPDLILSFPVIYPGTGSPEGVLAARFSLRRLGAIARQDVPAGLDITLLNREIPAAGPANSADGVISVRTPLPLAEPLAALGLTVRVSEPMATAMRPLYDFAFRFAALAILTIAVTLLLARYASHRLTERLARLGQSATAIIQGEETEIRSETYGRDEVAQLAVTLAQMLSQIRDANRTLEDRVTQRTEELRQAETRLRQEAARLDAILSNVGDGIVTLTSHGEILTANPAAGRLFTLPPDQLRGMSIGLLIGEAERTAIHDEIRRLAETDETVGSHAPRHSTGLHSDGSEFALELSFSVVGQGPDSFVVGLLRDVSQRKMIEDNLAAARDLAEKANRMKSDFLAIMSHEIRTPLNGVLGSLDLLLRSPIDPEQKRLVEIARNSGRSLLTIVSDVLDMSKMEAGRLELNDTDFNLHRIVADVMDTIELQARSKSLSVRSTIAPEIPVWVKGDPDRLRQILGNLLVNAVKFTERGYIALSIQPDESRPEMMAIRIADSGIGIEARDLGRLFTPFTQIDGGHRRRHGGTGLGLVIAKSLSEAMGGDITVSSIPGQGSVFTVTLPIRQGVEQDETAQTAQNLPRLSGRILLAEDSEANQLLSVSMLAPTGLTIDCVGDGRAAIEAAKSGRYDLVLMDVSMPEMDGLEATKAIRALPPPTGTIPIIAMTAYAMRSDIEMCLAAGMNAHISKPLSQSALVDRIAHFLPIAGPGDHSSPPAVDTAPKATPSHLDLDETLVSTLIADTDEETARRIAQKVAKELLGRRDAISQLAADGDLAQIGREAHAIKSLAATFGFEPLRALAQQTETAAHDGDATTFDNLADLLERTTSGAVAIMQRFQLDEDSLTQA